MTKKQQNLAWASLPEEARDILKESYDRAEHYKIQNFSMDLREVFGHHNLTSDTEPKEMLHCSRDFVMGRYKHITSSIAWNEGDKRAFMAEISLLRELFGDKCLPDKEPSVQVEPRFKVGDKVRIISGCNQGEITEVISVDKNDVEAPYLLDITDEEGGRMWYAEAAIAPYTEPEKGNNVEKSGNNSEIPNHTKDNMEVIDDSRFGSKADKEKELNLCELLKGCEEEEFYSNAYGEVTFIDFIEHFIHGTLIHISWSLYEKDDYECNLHINGCETPNGSCILWPSKKLYEKFPLDPYSAWMEWKSERTPKRWRAKREGQYWCIGFELQACPAIEHYTKVDTNRYKCGNYFRTEEEAQQAAETVRECLMKFHEKNIEK